jgi:hypothetical protein
LQVQHLFRLIQCQKCMICFLETMAAVSVKPVHLHF